MAYILKDKKNHIITRSGHPVMAADMGAVFKAVDMGARTLLLTGTDETKDRDGDITTHKGWKFENFYKNPVFMWAHNYDGVPLARTERIFSRPKLKRHDFLMRFPTEGLNPFGDMVLGGYDQRVINASSVGFIPIKSEEMEDDGGLWGPPRKFIEKELLELSGCGVPSNPNAVQDYVKSVKGNSETMDIIQAYLKGEKFELPHKDDLLEELRVREVEIVEGDKIRVFNNFSGKKKGFESFVLVEDVEEEKQVEEKEIEPVEEWIVKRLASQDKDEISKDEVLKPYPNEHACRLEPPGDFDSFRRNNCAVKSDGKCIDHIYGIKDGESKLQAMRYNKEIWTAAEARSHCKDKGGTFEAAGEADAISQMATRIFNEAKEIAEIDFTDFLERGKTLQLKDFYLLLHYFYQEQKSGAVLSAKNLSLLNTAAENIQKVIESAKKEEEDQLLEPKGDKSEKPDTSTVYDVILEPKGANRDENITDKHGEAIKDLCSNLKELGEQLRPFMQSKQ